MVLKELKQLFTPRAGAQQAEAEQPAASSTQAGAEQPVASSTHGSAPEQQPQPGATLSEGDEEPLRVAAGASGPSGSLPPGAEQARLAPVNAEVLASQSGPEGGIRLLRRCAPDMNLAWDKGADWACGSAISMYDACLTAGKFVRSGDPIADCFAIVAYRSGALLAVADGVGWGEPARRAACCAVLASTQHLHVMLQGLHGAAPGPSASHVLHEMVASTKKAQALIMQQCGTLTTLVVTVVLKLEPGTSSSGASQQERWAAMTLNIGDSAAYVYRAQQGTVQELTYAAHAGCTRNPESPHGALGYAVGDEPDLETMTASLAWLHEGDLVFLSSDGVSDNFNPSMLKMARPLSASNSKTHHSTQLNKLASVERRRAEAQSLPAWAPPVMHDKSMQLLQQAIEALANPASRLGTPDQALDRFAVTLDDQSDDDNTGGSFRVSRKPPSRASSNVSSNVAASPSQPAAPSPPPHSQGASRRKSEQIRARFDLQARVLVDGLLQHVHQVTGPQRLHVAAMGQAAASSAASAAPPRIPPAVAAALAKNRQMQTSISVDPDTDVSLSGSQSCSGAHATKESLPGKMDHATVVAFKVGNH